ncbi:MAG: hypothetical protein GXP26_05880 [Planctomycetes bacterium]|nr:hypothetical protein [Planctomycetota bacterium]
MDESLVDDRTPTAVYYPVSLSKFIVLSLLTGGVYELYWFYKNWRFVRDRDNSTIRPFWRALFAPLWCAALILDLRESVQDKAISIVPIVFLSIAYFVLSILVQLPDPYWIVTFLAFVPLVPVVRLINASNQDASQEYISNSTWKLRHFVLALFSIPLLSIGVSSSVGLIPSTQVIPGSLLWPHQREYLENSGIVEADEKIIYFYSEGFLSIKDDGNLLTDHGVISYWWDEESNEFYIEKAVFSDISKIIPKYGNFIESTLVTITRHDESEFDLLLSTEDHRDRLFLRKLEGILDR